MNEKYSHRCIIAFMTFTVAVVGASGYAGGEVLRLLLAHPEVTIGPLTAASSAGTQLGVHHPHLLPIADRVIQETSVEAIADADVVFMGLPHGASGAIAQQLEDSGSNAIVLDAGADFRLVNSADWEAFYKSEHAGTWPYGLAELMHAGEKTAGAQREILRSARRIALPGCNVAAVTLASQPGIGMLDYSDLVVTLAVGYSGAGKAPKPNLIAAEALESAAPYAAGGTHRHIPEIEQNLRGAGADDPRVQFQPVLVPMSRGILATVSAPFDGTTAQLRAAWESAYADEPFIHLLPEGALPTTKTVAGSNGALIQVMADPHAGRALMFSAIDNLGKGTAGSGIQAMNLALGLEETTGLSTIGLAP